MSLDFLKEIESKKEIEEVSFKGVQVWPVVRVYLAMQKLAGLNVRSDSGSKFTFKQALKGFRHYFGRYDYLFFANSSTRKEVDGKSIDRCVGLLSAKFQRSLIIETPHSYDVTQGLPYFEKNRVSSLALHALMLGYKKLFLRTPKIVEEAYLDSIINSELQGFNYREVIRKFWSKYVIYSWLLRIYKPKAVFVVCSYTNHGLVLACKNLGIPILEAQHGMINKAHQGYSFFRQFDMRLFPDFLLSYGNYEKKMLDGANWIPISNIIPIGNFGLESGVTHFENQDFFKDQKEQFKFTFCVSGQMHLEEDLYSICRDIAMRDVKLLIWYIPRNRDWTPEKYMENEPTNLKIVRNENIYNMIRTADYHVTCFSSCAYEALALGKKNLFFNINGFSEEVFYDLTKDFSNNLLIKSADDFFERFSQFSITESNEENLNTEYLSQGYESNLKRISKVLLN